MRTSLLADSSATPTTVSVDGTPVLMVPARTTALEQAGTLVLRYSLVLIVLWFGVFKFTPTEAAGIQPLFAHSPLFAWLYDVLSVRAVSNLVGAAEILLAVLIAVRPVAPRLSYWGSLGAVLMFAVTLSFLFTTPGTVEAVDGLWVPSGTGSFLLKDLTLLGAALYTAAEARRAV